MCSRSERDLGNGPRWVGQIETRIEELERVVRNRDVQIEDLKARMANLQGRGVILVLIASLVGGAFVSAIARAIGGG